MMDYIDNIEVIKNNDVIKIKNINFRKTFIEEYANLFNNGAINRYQDILVNDESRQIEMSKPMTRNEIHNYLKNLQTRYPIFDYHEIKKEQINDTKIYLKYERENTINEPFKLIPILNNKSNNVTHYGVIEISIIPTKYT